MNFDVVLWVQIFLIATTLILGVLAVMTFHRRSEAPEASAFGWLVVASAIYVFGYSGEVSQTSLQAAQHWLAFERLALPWLPGLWLLAAFRHNGQRAPAYALFIIPTIGFIAEYTNRWHGLFYGPMSLVQHGPFFVLEMRRGPIAILCNIYLLFACLVAPWLYIARFRHSSPLFRRQAMVVIISSFLPFIAYFTYLGGLSPWGLDIAPLALAISAVLFYYGVFRLSTFDLDPMARSLVFKGMRDPVLIVDNRGRLLDFNPAAASVIRELDNRSVGQPVAEVFTNYPALSEALLNATSREITLGSEPETQYFDIRTFPLTFRKMELGHAAILADITSQARLREELRVHAETDDLTGIANRRRFLMAMKQECARYNRFKGPFSLLLIDIDRFKSVNDLHGHPAGDAVLRAIVHRLKTCFREIDLFARYGGEEFSVLLVEAGRDVAATVAETVRHAIATESFTADGNSLRITVSIGVVTQQGDTTADCDTLLKLADLALYRAKDEGRNRVVEAPFLPVFPDPLQSFGKLLQ